MRGSRRLGIALAVLLTAGVFGVSTAQAKKVKPPKGPTVITEEHGGKAVAPGAGVLIVLTTDEEFRVAGEGEERLCSLNANGTIVANSAAKDKITAEPPFAHFCDESSIRSITGSIGAITITEKQQITMTFKPALAITNSLTGCTYQLTKVKATLEPFGLGFYTTALGQPTAESPEACQYNKPGGGLAHNIGVGVSIAKVSPFEILGWYTA